MEKLPVEHVPGHEVADPQGAAAYAVDQHHHGEAADQQGAQLYGSGVHTVELQGLKLHG